jgi:hypothetical protein
MKKLLLYLFVITSQVIYSQTTTSLTVHESPEYKDEVRVHEILSIHTTKSGKTGIIRKAKRNIQLDIFDAQLNKTFSKTIDHHKREIFVGEIFHNEEIKFFTVFSPKKKIRILYCHIFNLKDKSHKKVKLFETTVEKKRSLFFARNKRQTAFAISPDGNYFVINTDNYKKNINSYTIRVFDAASLQLVYTKMYQTHEDRYFEPNDLLIDNNQTVYTLGKSFLSGSRQKKNKEANYQFILNKITKDKSTPLKVTLENEYIQSLVFSKVKDQLHLLGFYSEKNVGRIKGGCDFIVETNSLAIAGKKKYELPQKVYDDLYNYRASKRKKKKKKELSNFSVDYVLNDDEGNTFLIAEEFYITQTYIATGNFGGYWTTTFHYDDVLILKFDASGQLGWGRSIFKRSTVPSYNAFIKEGKLQIILNSGKNLIQKKDGRTKVSQGWFESSALYNIAFTKDGKISYEKIQDNKGKTFYLPYYGTYENDTFIMPSTSKKRKRFMILK